jgi:pimeloyl-ACP methyl ester carboxylesterase
VSDQLTLVSEKLTQAARIRGIRHEMHAAGTVTRYWHYPADRVDAPAVVFIHGYRGNHRGLEAITGALGNLNIYIPDLPGFGESTPFSGEHTIELYSKWVGEFISGLRLDAKPHLLGHSFGSIVVARHAAESDDFESLILENPVSAPALKGPKAALTGVAKSFFWLAQAMPLKLGEGVLKSWPMVRGMSIVMTKSRNAELRSWVHAQHDANFNDFANRRVAVEGYNASVSDCVSNYSAKFKTPVLVISGGKDDITSPSQQNEMISTITPPVTHVDFAKVGHLTHYEVPGEVALAIQNFISNQG